MAEVHQRRRRRKGGDPSLVVRRLEAFIAAAEALHEAWDPLLDCGGCPRYLLAFADFLEDLRDWMECTKEARDVALSEVEPLDFTDAKEIEQWLDAVDCAAKDAVAAGDDATRSPGRRLLGRATARAHVAEARHKLRSLVEAARRGAPTMPVT